MTDAPFAFGTQSDSSTCQGQPSDEHAKHPISAPLAIHDMTVAYHRRPVLWDIDYDATTREIDCHRGPQRFGKDNPDQGGTSTSMPSRFR